MKNLISLFFALVLFSLLIADGTPPDGSGTENDPYQIATLDNLLWLSTTQTAWDSIYYFLQTQDIDASDTQNWNGGDGFSPIGIHDYGYDEIPFQGTYNGGYHYIDGLYINGPYHDIIGLFGLTSGAGIEALGMTNIDITGNWYVGGLVGWNDNSTLSECYVTGSVTGDQYVGGLVGRNDNSTLSESYTEGNVTGNYATGGGVGYNNYSIISYSYSTCIMTRGHYVGGLVGWNDNSTLSESYATGSVTGSYGVGGLVGWNDNSTLSNTYSTGNVSGYDFVGGLVGYNYLSSTLSESYYDYETVLINNQHLISISALTSELYNDWINNNMSLEITDYLSSDGDNYLINNTEDFEKLLAFGQNSEYSFLLTADLDLTGNPNFYIPYFTGTFDGDNHIIDGLNVYSPAIFRIGLFGCTDGALIETLCVTNINVTGGYCAGGLVGYNNCSTLSKCLTTGNVNGECHVGGLVGTNDNNSTISESYTTVSVIGDESAGGLVGTNDNNSTISESYATGSVTGDDSVGGLVGRCDHSSTISDSYVTGSVAGEYYVGGLAGDNSANSTINDSYAIGSVTGDYYAGGLVGWNSGSQIECCIWNIETSEQVMGVGCNNGGLITNLLGGTTAEMQIMSTYTDIGWDFAGESINGDEDIWDINYEINDGFPFIYDIEYPVNNDEDEIIIENGKGKMEIYPNPFNPVTNICFDIKESGDVLLKIYNLRGRKVETLADSHFEAGKHSIIWNAENQSSGIYLISCKSRSFSEVKRVILLK